MRWRVRLSLPDRPGSLALVTDALGRLGADVVAVSVLGRESVRAWDDFTVVTPDIVAAVDIRGGLARLPGVAVEGVWPTRDAPGAFPDLDAVYFMLGHADRALVTVVDALPGILSASWAVALGPPVSGSPRRALLARSHAAPAHWAPPEELLERRGSVPDPEGGHLTSAPVGALGVVTIARAEGAPFHRHEQERLARMVEIVDLVTTRAGVILSPGGTAR